MVDFSNDNGTLVTSETAAVSVGDYQLNGDKPCYAQTAASASAGGTDVVWRYKGRVNGVAKDTGSTWTPGQGLLPDSVGAWDVQTVGYWTAIAATSATAAATTGDIILESGSDA